MARMRGIAGSSILAAALWMAAIPARAGASTEPAPLYFDRVIAEEDLRGKTLRELELIRATILGRAGMVFLDRWVREYMAQADWYQPGTYDATRLSAVDVRNLRTVAAYKAALPRSELKQRWDELLGAHRWSGLPAMQHRLAFSEDGSAVAVGPSPLLAPRWPLALFRTSTGERISTIPWAAGPLHALRFAGSELVVASDYDLRVGGWHFRAPPNVADRWSAAKRGWSRAAATFGVHLAGRNECSRAGLYDNHELERAGAPPRGHVLAPSGLACTGRERRARGRLRVRRFATGLRERGSVR
jgi:hypothetical protein